MSSKQVVIYRAGTPEDAYLLKNLLADAGIRAEVINDTLTGGSARIVGWSVLPAVMVNQDDAQAARQMAVEFDRQDIQSMKAAEPADFEADEPRPDKLPDDWPMCPQCDRRRTTACPFCGTSGTDFQPADRMPEETGEERGEEGGNSSATQSPALYAALRLCPTCDEPFSPCYLPVCEGCGHVFDAGAIDSTDNLTRPVDTINFRVVVALLATIGLIVAMVGYFVWLFR